MNTETKIYKNKDFVGQAVSGEVDPAKAITIARQYINLAHQFPDHNILVDLRDIRASISVVNLMDVTLEVVRHFPVFSNKIAHLTFDEKERVLIAKQLESCMVLKGFTYKVFTDFEEASGWLSKPT